MKSDLFGVNADPLLERVAQGAPVGDDFGAGPAFDAALAVLARSIIVEHPSAIRQGVPVSVPRRVRPRYRRMPRRVALIAVSVFSLSATAAVAYSATAHTGFFGGPGQTENDTSEFLDTAAPDFPAILRRLVPTEIALPSDASWESAIQHQIALGQRDHGLQQAAGIRATFAFYAYCSWVGHWLDVQGHGDAGAATAAAAGIAAVPNSPVVGKVDGGGIRVGMRRVAAAAGRGDVAAVRSEYELNCDGQR